SERSAHIAREAPREAPALSAELLRPPLYLDLLRYWIVPEARGNPRDGDKFGPYSFAGRTGGYAGILVLARALAAFSWRRAPAAASFCSCSTSSGSRRCAGSRMPCRGCAS